ncbi:MAG: Na-K-Cl cotransporter [Balneolaceae bacterium]|nr:Na-K-Cl cotransporter [Balneolaceae bacterium]MBO6544839.1 Na-K-Cl cotransporter [Balneolaceae bacterium]MBO6646235.1 Na-K-Cl cotransporter [Balneolaceae bacterium]
MYLRFGWVVGNVGLWGSLLIVTLATTITFLTSLSVAAIATDQRVRIGGAYYMISRSLGIESGGAIGIPLYIALALSVALYVVGFAESVVGVFPGLSIQWVGLITTLAVTGLALVSAKAAIRAQYIIMLAIALSLLSLIFGTPVEASTASETVSASREPFWVVFAVFFPAVTGIMAGVNMSGDLKNPTHSIPRGTFAAIGTGYVIYIGLVLILAFRATPDQLIEDPLIMRKMAFWGDAILLGVWGATLSSAVGSILGGPRVLQALAKDKILPSWLSWLGTGSGEEEEPRYGTLFTMMIALVAVWFGDLNLIAPILSMFFLTTYGVINLAAGIEKLLDSPSYRPTFKVHWSISLLGALGCFSVMFLINITATLIALVFVGIIFTWLERRELTSVWGNVKNGLLMAVIREALLKMSDDYEPKNWRPRPLVLSGSPRRRWHLIDFANSLTHNRGILTVATVFPDESIGRQRLERMEDEIGSFLKKRAVEALVRVIASDDPFMGSVKLVEAYGIGKLVPNTIILGGSETPEIREKYCGMIQSFYEMQRNVILIHGGETEEEKPSRKKKRIDLWWGGFKGNGGLMMILVYMLQNSISWKGAEIHLKIIVEMEDAVDEIRANMREIVNQIRFEAEIDVIVSKSEPFEQVFKKTSKDADLILLGMATPGDDFTGYYENMLHLTEEMPTTVFVLAGQEISFGEVLIPQDTMTTS